MPKVFITGLPGTGKTTITQALSTRGFTAYSTEEIPGVNRHFDTQTERFVPRPAAPIDYSRYQNTWDRPKIMHLLESDETVFIADLNATQANYFPLFDVIICLTIDENTQKDRLLTRTSNPHNYGKHPDDLKAILSYRNQFQAAYQSMQGCICIDATAPLAVVVNEIIKAAHVS